MFQRCFRGVLGVFWGCFRCVFGGVSEVKKFEQKPGKIRNKSEKCENHRKNAMQTKGKGKGKVKVKNHEKYKQIRKHRFFLKQIAKHVKNTKKSKKKGQRRRDSAVCRTELLASNFSFFGPLGPHGAPGPPKK